MECSSYTSYVNYLKNFTVQEFLEEEKKLFNDKRNANDADKVLINQKIIILRQVLQENYYYLYF